MKRFVLCFLLIIFFARANSAVITWTGLALDGKWGTAGNWSSLTVPIATDDVIFTAISVTVEMDVLPAVTPFTYTINSLLITANSIVILQRTQAGGGSRIFQLASISSLTPGLKINNGSTLTIDAINTTTGSLNFLFAFTGGAGVTGEVFGNLYIKGNGVIGTCAAEIDLQDDPAHYAALVVKNSGVIKYFDNTGNTSPATGNYLTMESGSIYELNKNGGSFPPGAWDPNSLAKVSGTGASPPSFNGTAYGNLEWDCPFQTTAAVLNADVSFNNVNFISTNNTAFRVKAGASAGNYTMTINGNLDISTDSYVEMISATSTMLGTSGKISLKGNLNNQGTLITNGIAGTSGQFELSGSSNQNISNTGIFQGIRLEFIMNGVSATLLTNLTLPGDNAATGPNLQLLNGKIITTAAAILRMNDNATVSGGSSNSFVSGPMRKFGDDDFIFPVGKGSIYAPIGITNVSGASTGDAFTAEYIRANPQSVHGTTYQPPIDHISYVEYWTLDRNAGSAIKTVSLAVNFTSFCYNLSKTYVSRYDNTKWTYEGSTNVAGPVSPPYVTGTITSVNTISSFTPVPNAFTLSTDLPFNANPLPINLISFDVIRLTNTKSTINWELAACCSPAARFEIQRADAGKSFSVIATINGSATNRFYSYTDNGLKNGINYYRLKMTDADGTVTFSRTVAVMNGLNSLLLTSLIPTIINNNTAMLTVASSREQKLDLVIIDMQGKIIQKSRYTVTAGNTNIPLSTAGMAAGIYQLTGASPGGKTNTIRFIRQ